MSFDRGARLTKLHQETQQRHIYTVTELSKRAKALYGPLPPSTQALRAAITHVDADEYHAALRVLLRAIFLPEQTRAYVVRTPQTVRKAQIMLHLWKAIDDFELGYPIETEMAKGAALIAAHIFTEEGTVDL